MSSPDNATGTKGQQRMFHQLFVDHGFFGYWVLKQVTKIDRQLRYDWLQLRLQLKGCLKIHKWRKKRKYSKTIWVSSMDVPSRALVVDTKSGILLNLQQLQYEQCHLWQFYSYRNKILLLRTFLHLFKHIAQFSVHGYTEKSIIEITTFQI